MAKTKITHCPNCGCEWTEEEQALIECFDCGYPEVDLPPSQGGTPDIDMNDE